MKKRTLSRVLLMLFCMLISLLTTSVFAGEVSQNTIDQEYEIGQKEEACYFLENDANLFAYDWKNASDEELDIYLAKSQDDQIAAWISSLSQEEIEMLMHRKTLLVQTMDYYGDGCEQCGYTWGTHFERALDYYLTLAGCEKKKATYTFVTTSGYVELAFAVEGKEPDIARIKVSNVDTSRRTSLRQFNLSCTVSNAKYGLALQIPEDKKWHTWAASSKQTDVEDDLKKCKEKGPESINYFDFVPEVYFTKPAGYRLSNPVYSGHDTTLHTFYTKCTKKTYTYENSTQYGILFLENPLTGEDTYALEKEIRFRASANMGRNYGLGVRSQTQITTPSGNHERVTFTLVPAKYTMKYDVTQGMGSVASQNVTYGNTYTYPAGPTPAEYSVSYQANGGNSNLTTQQVPRLFLGWSSSQSAGSGNTGSFLANQYVNGAVVTNYAIWGGAAKSIVLPSAGRSYTVNYDANGGVANQSSATAHATFLGWSESASEKTNVKKAGSLFTPSNSMTLYAQYENGSVVLPNALRRGYRFAGWYSGPVQGTLINKANATYQPVKNTTLYARWLPIAYQIHLDPAGGVLEKQENIMHALYDQSVHLPYPEKKGYLFKGWKTETAIYRAENVLNLTETDGAIVTLVAAWEPDEVPYRIRCFFRKKTGTEYVLDDTKTQYCTAKADTIICVPAMDMIGFKTPAAKLVTILADGSSCVDFYYDKVETSNYESAIEESNKTLEDIAIRLKEIDSISHLSNADWEKLNNIIISVTGLKYDAAKQLEQIIRDNTVLKEEEKRLILKAFTEGYLTEEVQKKLIGAIEQADITDAQKKELIDAILQMSNLTIEQQQKLRELLEIGSSVSMKMNGVLYEVKKNADGALSIFLKGLEGKKEVVIPDSITIAGKSYPITEISKNAFKKNALLESVIIGNNIAKIGESAFADCKALKAVVIGPNVKEIGDKAFQGCEKLLQITIPASVLRIGDYAFESCKGLRQISFMEGLMQIGRKAFYRCSSLTKVKLPRSLIKISGYAFGYCTKLKTVTFAADSLLVTMHEGVFAQCKSLTKIKIPPRVTSIAKKTFYKDSKLASVTGMKRVSRIGVSAFEGCKKMRSITLSTRLQKIEKRAFYQCSSLKKVTLKSTGITYVGKQAFEKCSSHIRFSIPVKKQKEYAALFAGKY